MTGAEPDVPLEGMKHGDPEPHAPSADATERAPASPTPGLATLHAALDRLVSTLGLHALTVVVDDPDLGRQAFRAGPGPFEAGALSGAPGCRTDPELPANALDLDLLRDLCAASLRVEVLAAEAADSSERDAGELALRRIPGVRAVVVEEDAGLFVVQVFADADAAPDLARTASRIAAGLRDGRVVVEILRDAATVPVVAEPAPVVTAPDADGVDANADADEPPSRVPTRDYPLTVPTLVAVRSDVETGEIEVHMRGGEIRAIGRAPASEGLTGAAGATLHALHDVGDADADLTLSWVRTIETTADRRFVVAVALLRGRSRTPRHGLGSGADTLEAAARATLDAVLRPDEPDTGSEG